MTNLQIQLLKIATDEALLTIAAKHCTSVEVVRVALEESSPVVCAQFQKLVELGFATAAKEVRKLVAVQVTNS